MITINKYVEIMQTKLAEVLLKLNSGEEVGKLKPLGSNDENKDQAVFATVSDIFLFGDIACEKRKRPLDKDTYGTNYEIINLQESLMLDWDYEEYKKILKKRL